MPLIPDIKISVQNQAQLVLDPVVKGGLFQRSKNGQLLLYAGGFTAVFPVIINGEKWAFRCWHVPITDASKRLRLVSEFILNNTPSYLVPLEYTARGIIVKGEIFPTTRMKWIEGKNIKKYLCENVGKKQSLLSIASTFLSLIEDMHRLGVSHGDLQHGNILVTENEDVFLVDYDSMYVPTMGNEYKDEIVGKEDYQHPKRKNNKISNRKVDYFSELIIYLSIIGLAENPQLSTKYKLPDTEFLLFSAADFKGIEKSAVYKDLQSLNIPLVNHLLDVLSAYLKVDDINKLTPFNEDGKFKTLLSSYFKSEDDLWSEVKSADNIDAYQNYLKHYPRGRYNIVARRKLKGLLEKQLNKEEFWNNASQINTETSYNNYLRNFPEGKYQVVAKRKIDLINKKREKRSEEELWIAATKNDTLASYRHYIACSTLKKHIKEAKNKVEDFIWTFAVGRNTKEAYNTYIQETELESHLYEAYEKIDELLWELALRLKSKNGYRTYLKDSPIGGHKSEAIKEIDEIQWQTALDENTLDGYRKYNDSAELHRAEANKKIAEFDEQFWEDARKQDTISSYDYYLSHFPFGRYSDNAHKRRVEIEQDEVLWAKLKTSHSLVDYSHYLELFPNGKYAEVAYKVLSKRKNRKKWGTVFITCITILCICFWGKVFISNIQNSPKTPQITSRPPKILSSPEIDMSSIEKELEKKIIGMETAKKCGDPVNAEILRESKDLLNKIKTSSKYNYYEKRINALVQ